MKLIFVKILILLLFFPLSAKSSNKVKVGEISYKTSQHYYIRFETTLGINPADTLYFEKDEKSIPVLIVNYLSTKSCACSKINSIELKIGDKVFAKRSSVQELDVKKESPIKPEQRSLEKREVEPFAFQNVQTKKTPSVLTGRISAQNLNSFSNYTNEYQRSRYTFSANYKNFAGDFSLSSYMNYSYRSTWLHNFSNKQLTIYDLTLNYSPDQTFNIWAGRFVNPKVSNISSVDGIQTEKKFKNNFAGILVGSRPDFLNFSYNAKLFEFGGYVGRGDTLFNGYMENTLAFFNQTNNFITDRRYIYFQHTNNLVERLNLFFSSEVDLYQKERGTAKTVFSPTSIFFLTRYSFKPVSFSFSYDARKNVIYYETFKNLVDSILDKETRQGIRVNISVRPFNKVFVGLNSGYRFQKSDIKPSRNYGGYISYSSIPYIGVSSSLSFSKLITNYLDGNNFGILLSRDFSSLAVSLNYRYIDYSFSSSKMIQNILSADLSYRITKQLFILASYETIFEKKNTNNRLLFDLSIRF